MVTKPSSEQSQDFSIHNEDFPALPGPNYQTKDPTSHNEDSKTVRPFSVLPVMWLQLSLWLCAPGHAVFFASQPVPSHSPFFFFSPFLSNQNLNSSGKPSSNSDGPKFPGDKSSAPSNNNQQKKGIQVLPDGESLSHTHTHSMGISNPS